MRNYDSAPWRVDGRGFRPDTRNGGEFVPIIGSGNQWIADVRRYREHANLIAMAPEMHYALTQFQELMRTNGDVYAAHWLRKHLESNQLDRRMKEC